MLKFPASGPEVMPVALREKADMSHCPTSSSDSGSTKNTSAPSIIDNGINVLDRVIGDAHRARAAKIKKINCLDHRSFHIKKENLILTVADNSQLVITGIIGNAVVGVR